VVDVNDSHDPVEEYLDQLYASLRTTPREARRIIAEAEDHLRESVEAGLAAGLTERAAQEAAISSFGSVRAVVRAHARRVPPVTVLGELVMAAWKLGSIALLAVAASGVVALVMNVLLGRQFGPRRGPGVGGDQHHEFRPERWPGRLPERRDRGPPGGGRLRPRAGAYPSPPRLRLTRPSGTRPSAPQPSRALAVPSGRPALPRAPPPGRPIRAAGASACPAPRPLPLFPAWTSSSGGT